MVKQIRVKLLLSLLLIGLLLIESTPAKSATLITNRNLALQRAELEFVSNIISRDHNSIGSEAQVFPAIRSSVQQPLSIFTDTFFVHLPVIYTAPDRIFGSVVQKSQPVVGVTVTLHLVPLVQRYYPTLLETVMTATTNLNGQYEFISPPHLNERENMYYVRYLNPKKPPEFGDERVAAYFISTPGTTNNVSLEVPRIDIQDAKLVSPFDPNYAITFTIPNTTTFRWSNRHIYDGIVGSKYFFRIYKPNPNPYTSGYIYNISNSGGDSLTLSGVLPDEISYDTPYVWDVFLREDLYAGPYAVSYNYGMIIFKK
jgi:hypothetical protein